MKRATSITGDGTNAILSIGLRTEDKSLDKIDRLSIQQAKEDTAPRHSGILSPLPVTDTDGMLGVEGRIYGREEMTGGRSSRGGVGRRKSESSHRYQNRLKQTIEENSLDLQFSYM